MRIELIAPEHAYPLRQSVLRPHMPLADSQFKMDRHPESFHLGAFVEDRIVCVATFQRDDHPDFPAQKAYRLRGMATDPAHQGKGIGAAVLRHGQALLTEKNSDFLWFNARPNAFGFYEKLGFLHSGEFFEIESIGPHKVMYKKAPLR